MEKLKTPFYYFVCTVFLIAVSIASMALTTGLAFAENKRYREGKISVIEEMEPTLEQLSRIKVSEL